MDKADVSFLIAAFLYMLLVLARSLGLVNETLLDFAFVVLWGVLFLTTLLKTRFYYDRTSDTLKMRGIILATLIIIIAFLIQFINFKI